MRENWRTVLEKLNYVEPEPVFHLFPQLPLEIRRKIWQCRLLGPRYLRLETEALRTMKEPTYLNVITVNDKILPWSITSPLEMSAKQQAESDLLTTLHVNRESRLEMLRHYRILFIQDADLGSLTPYPSSRTASRRARRQRASKPICFDAKVDTICVRYVSLQAAFEAQIFSAWLKYVQESFAKGQHIRQLEIIYDTSTNPNFGMEQEPVTMNGGIAKLLLLCPDLKVLKLNLDMRMMGIKEHEDGTEEYFKRKFDRWFHDHRDFDLYFYGHRPELPYTKPEVQVRSTRRRS